MSDDVFNKNSTFSGYKTGGNLEVGPNSQLGAYTLVEPLGQGGMGQVWKASDGKRSVALKLLPPEFRGNAAAIAQVDEAFQVVHALTHQHICKTLGLFDDPVYGPFLVMDYVPGLRLSQFHRQGKYPQRRMPVETVVQILRPIAIALDYAHQKVITHDDHEQQGVLHRDVKPDNILVVTRDGQIREVWLIDFGLAAEIRSTMTKHTNATVDTRGTRPYMSPEQLRGKRSQWDGRTDQYALAVVCYELLSGHLPFEGDDDFVLMQAILNEAPDPVSGLPDWLNAAVLQALSKDRTQRFATCVAFVDALQKASAPKVEKQPEPPVAPPIEKPKPTHAAISDHPSTAPTAGNSGSTWMDRFALPKLGEPAAGASAAKSVGKPAPPPQLLVVPSPQYPTITAAMRAARTGNTIQVARGTYKEAIELKDGVSLTGDNRERCILKIVPGQVRVLHAANLNSGVVSGFTIDGEGARTVIVNREEVQPSGIEIVDSSITVQDCTFKNFPQNGIRVSGAKSAPTLMSNSCESNQQSGIFFFDGARGTAEENICRKNTNSGIGVFGTGTAPTLTANSCISNGSTGIIFCGGARGSADNNLCQQNVSFGILVHGAGSDPVLTANTCEASDSTGIGFSSGASGTATKNICRQNKAFGIFAHGKGTAPKLIANTCTKNAIHDLHFSEGAVERK